MPKRSRMPRDPNQLAKAVVDFATRQREPDPERVKDPAAVELGRKGGLVGGKARAAKLTAEERSESARKAAQARWGKASGDRYFVVGRDPSGVMMTASKYREHLTLEEAKALQAEASKRGAMLLIYRESPTPEAGSSGR